MTQREVVGRDVKPVSKGELYVGLPCGPGEEQIPTSGYHIVAEGRLKDD
jgi:hypothetical protein